MRTPEEASQVEARIIAGLAGVRAQLTVLENEIAQGEELGLDVSAAKAEVERLRESVGGDRG